MHVNNHGARDVFALRNGVDRMRVLIQQAMERGSLEEVRGDLAKVLEEAQTLLSGKVEHRPNLNGGGFDNVLQRVARPTKGR